jgi:arginyl-tRNA synthetase
MKKEVEKLVQAAVKKITGKDQDISLEYPRDESHGDFACTIAMQLSKELKKSPTEIAKEITDSIEKNEIIAETEIAGPGFINIKLSNTAIEKGFEEILKEMENKNLGKQNNLKKQKVIVDYSQPNIAKPLGIHHLLSTIIGQSLSNIFRFLGLDTLSINYIGDWGTQFGKLIYAYKTWGDKKVIEKDPIPELLKLYVKFHDEAEKDESIEDKGREEFKKLENEDKENTEIWEWAKKISLEDVERTYEKLGGIHFDHYWGEGHVRDKTFDVIEDGKKKGVFKKGEDGALMMFFPDEKYPPYMIQKKDGTTLYSTRDLATAIEREKIVGDGLVVYVVDVAQKLYFQQMLETTKILGYYKKAQPIHVVFGRMNFPDSSMSTRKGKVVLLDDVIDEAIERARGKIEEHDSKLPEKEKELLAKMIGVGAIKYNALSQNRTKDYTFVWDNMLSFDGNSAPYLQYAYTRTQSLLRKAKEKKISDKEKILIDNDEEMKLVREMAKFDEILAETITEYRPNILCTYLYELSQTFSLFYNNIQILSEENNDKRSTRLKEVQAFAYILKTGLHLLGIEVPDRM